MRNGHYIDINQQINFIVRLSPGIQRFARLDSHFSISNAITNIADKLTTNALPLNISEAHIDSPFFMHYIIIAP